MGYNKKLRKQQLKDARPRTQSQRGIIISRIASKYQSSAEYALAHLRPRIAEYYENVHNRSKEKEKKKHKNANKMPNQIKNSYTFLTAWFINDFRDHSNQREFRGENISKTYNVNALLKKNFSRILRGEGNVVQGMRDVIRNFDLLQDLNGQQLPWTLRWLPNFSNTLKNLDGNIRSEVLKRVVKLQLGYFEDIKVFRVGPIKYHFLGMIKVNFKFNLTFGVFPERVPQYSYQQKFVLNKSQVDQERSQNYIQGYSYRQVLVILDLVKTQTDYSTSFKKNQVKKYLDQMEGDPDRWGCFSFLADKDRKFEYSYPTDDYGQVPRLSRTLKNCVQFTQSQKYLPILHYFKALKQSEINKMKYSKEFMRYFNNEEKNQAETIKKDRQNDVLRDQILNKFADAQSARWFVGFLQKIPNFKLHLTEEESNTIGQNGNVLALGRSGTGKTTCSVLRLFATEVLFKLRLRHLMEIKNQESFKKSGLRFQKKKERFNYEDLGMSCGLHMVFVTASPVLTTEVKRFYESLKDKVAQELKKSKERKMKKRLERLQKQKKEAEQKKDLIVVDKVDEIKKQEEEQQKKQKAEQQSDDDDDEDQDEVKTELKLDELKAEQDKIQDELDLEQQLNLPDTFYQMGSDDFPVFLTIRRMIFMIDGCFTRSFFVRNSKRQIVGQSTSSQWHNESKGVMLINRYYKSGERRQDNSQKYISNDLANVNEILDSSSGQEDESGSDNDEEEEEKKSTKSDDNDFQKFSRNKKKKKQPQAVQVYSTEVDYDLFEHRIWPRIRDRNRPHLTSSLVWAQIMNRLKGGSQAHLHPAGYLDKFYYLNSFARYAPRRYNQNLKVSKSAKRGQKQLFYQDYEDIFEIFIKYQRWKVNYGAFDFCDVVNHILYSMRVGYAYRGAPLHFVMCDQVQDLPPCVSLLLIKLSDYCFFSGDSAQTIAKGVGFKFSDLIQLFNPNGFQSVTRWKAPVLHQLTINFRSHGKILDLANIIIKMIEIGYPTTIDKLKREVSWQDGMKPIILDSNLVECLFGVLVGSQALEKEQKKQNKQNQESQGLISKPPVQFGCDQVVIVRDQKAKNSLPQILSHALCLTIYQSKGLQFDDVILYNFFTDSSLSEKEWGLLKQLKVNSIIHNENELRSMQQKSKEKYENTVDTFGVKTTIQKREKTKQEIKQYIDQNYKHIGKAMTKHVKQNPDVDIDSLKYQDFIQEDDRYTKYTKETLLFLENEFHDKQRFSQELSLCTELKQLYVACTRPRKRLIIFDSDPSNRKIIHELFKEIDAVQTISYDDVYGESQNNKNMGQSQQPSLVKQQSSSSGKKYISKLANQTSESAWRQQGIRMFKRKFYSAALQCFRKSNEPQLEKRALAYVLAQRGANLQTQSEDMLQEFDLKQKNKAELNILKEQSKKVKQESKRVFIQSAKIFRQLGLIRQSAQCFYSGENYHEAAQSFLEIKYFAQAAECFCLSGNYSQAGNFYIEAGVHLKAAQMFMKDKNWERILETINMAKGVLEDDQIKQLIKKYTPQALSNLFEELSKKDEELKEEEEKQNMILEEKNQEEEEDDDDDEEDKKIQNEVKQEEEVDEEEEDKIQDQKLQDNQKDQSDFELNSQKPREKDSEQLSNFTLIDSIDVQTTPNKIKRKQEQEDVKSQGGSSFVSLHMSELNSTPDSKQGKNISSSKSDYTLVDINDDDDFEHLSHIDPNDQFLKSEKGSIIDSIVSIHRESKKTKNQNLKSIASLSSYSIVQDEATTNIDASTYNKITPQRHKDLFAEDQMIQKFIYYISLISQDVRTLMSQNRSKEVLIHADDQLQMPKQIQAVPAIIPAPQSKQIFLLDIDNIDINFLEIILNTLENFELYAFCLIICNRYQLSQNIGRYVVSLAYKYSNQYQLKLDQIDLIMNNQQQLINQKEVSAIAHGAVHNVFERIDPVYLRLKKIGQQMNEKNSIGLYAYRALWMLGYWKKLAFIMDSETSLLLLATVRDYEGFKMVYSINFNQNVKAQDDAEQLQWIVPKNKKQNLKEINKFQLMALVLEMKQTSEKIFSQLISRKDDHSSPISGINAKFIDTKVAKEYPKIYKQKVETLKQYFPHLTKYWIILSDLVQIANEKIRHYNEFLNSIAKAQNNPQKKTILKQQENKISEILKKNQKVFLERTKEITSLALYEWFPLLKKITHNQRIKHNFRNQELTSWDLFTTLSTYIIVALKWKPFKSYTNYLVKELLSYSEVLQFGSSLNLIARILKQDYPFFSTFDIAVSAFSQLFHCHHIPQNWLFENDSGFVIVERKSQLLQSLLKQQRTIKQKQKYEIQERILKKFAVKDKKSKKMEKYLQAEMQKESAELSQQKEIRLGDLQGQFVLSPLPWVMSLIQQEIIRFGRVLLLNKIKFMVEVPHDLGSILDYSKNIDISNIQMTSMYGQELEVSLLKDPIEEEKKEGQEIISQQQDLKDLIINNATFNQIATFSRAMLFSYATLGSLYNLISIGSRSSPIYLNTLSNIKFNEKRLQQLHDRQVSAKQQYSLLADFTKQQINYSQIGNNYFAARKAANQVFNPKNAISTVSLTHIKNSSVQQKLAIQFLERNLSKTIKKLCRFGLLNYGLRDVFILPQNQIKNVMIQLATDNWRRAMESLNEIDSSDLDNGQDFTSMAEAFNNSFASFTYFSSINQIYLFQDLVRTFSLKSSRYLSLNKKLVSKFYNSIMTLIDALVYYRQDFWSQAADCLTQYTTVTIDYLSYKNQAFLFQKCTMLYLAAMASAGRVYQNSQNIIVQEKQYVHYPFVVRKRSSIGLVIFEADFQRKLVNSSSSQNLSGLTKKLISLAFKLVQKHCDDLLNDQSTTLLLNSVVSILINVPDNQIRPLQITELHQLFQYILESSSFNDSICERFMTTKSLNEIRSSIRDNKLKINEVFFSDYMQQALNLVSVNFIKQTNKIQLKNKQQSAYKHLDKLFLKQSQVIASHIHLARIFKRYIEYDNKKIRSLRSNLKSNQHCKIAEYIRNCSQQGSDVEYNVVRIMLRVRKDMVNMIEKLGCVKSVVNNIFYKSQMPNVLDVHYLLTRYGEVGHQMKRVFTQMHNDLSHGGAIEGYSGNSQKLNGNIREWIKMVRDTLSTWKMTKFEVSKASIEHKRRIIKLKWKEHRIHQAQAALKKRKGQGKQKKLADKKKRIMERENARKGPAAKDEMKKLLVQKLIQKKRKE